MRLHILSLVLIVVMSVSASASAPKANPYALIAGTALAVWAAAGNDGRASSRAVSNTPVFGSPARAKQVSDALEYVSIGVAAAIYTIKYLPPVDRPFTAPAQIYAATHAIDSPHPSAGLASGAMAFGVLEVLKRHTERPRPDGRDTRSYPSGHTAAVAWAGGVSAEMVYTLGLRPQYEIPARGALALATIATAWGRVEAQKHYPSDVLAGALLGAALTDISMMLFDDGRGYNSGFSIYIARERLGMTTSFTTTVDF